MIKLNLGCGKDIREGYDNIDIFSQNPKVIKGDVTNLSNYQDNSVDEVLALDIIEHFPGVKVLSVLKEWCRVLKPGGLLIIRTPDIEVIFDHFYPKAKNGQITWKRLSDIINGSQTTPYQFHHVTLSYSWLNQMLEECGIVATQKVRISNQNMVVHAWKGSK